MTAAFVAEHAGHQARARRTPPNCTARATSGRICAALLQHIEQVYAAQRGRWQHDPHRAIHRLRGRALRHWPAAAFGLQRAFMAGALAALTTKGSSERLMAELVQFSRAIGTAAESAKT